MASATTTASSVPEGDEFEHLIDEPMGDDAEADRMVEIEARARRQGWRPLEEYTGPAGKWVDAEEFLNRGDNFLPFVRKKLKDTEEQNTRILNENATLRQDLQEVRGMLVQVRKYAQRASEEGYQRAKAEYEAERRNAAAAGDMTAYDEADEKLKALEAGRQDVGHQDPPPAEEPPPRPQPQPNVQIPPEVQRFVAENPWFNSDAQLNASMQGHHTALMAAKPGLTLEQNLAEAKKRVMADFPEKFGLEPDESFVEEPVVEQPRRPAQPSRPTPPAQRRPPGQQPTGWNQITDPAERATAQKAYASMKRHDPELTVEDYLKIYNDPRADILALRAEKNARRA